MPPKDWAEELNAFALNAQMTTRAFLLDHHKLWSQPKLLSLPQVYDGIFQVCHVTGGCIIKSCT